MQSYYRCLIPRLNGDEIIRNFSHYLSFVKKGVAGFIIFGGRLADVRKHIVLLQGEADMPLIIASDLERGLGQQIAGGTPFPPAMALAHAARKNRGKDGGYNLSLLRQACSAVAEEAAYAGINTILAPVLDINTNPRNPIIATRAFGDNAETVSLLGCEMVKALQSRGIAACGKHFPGHGDTEVDSHISLPVIHRGMSSLRKTELKPFRDAVAAGVKMVMLGHLRVPALDPSGVPVTLSPKAVSYLRKKMRYRGIVITDAMNMGGRGEYSEEKACLMALTAGVDLILHPSDTDRVASYLKAQEVNLDTSRLEDFRRSLLHFPGKKRPSFRNNAALSQRLTNKSIALAGGIHLKGRFCLVILNDEEGERGTTLARKLRKERGDLKVFRVTHSSEKPDLFLPEDASVIVAIFSETRGWKGGAGAWIYQTITRLAERADIFISFGSPYLLDGVTGVAKLFAFWDSPSAQEAVARLLLKRIR
jgi:beta-glucosidase-like glycosyl hydrolase